MRAVIVCADVNPALHGLDEHRPAALIPLGDRPLLQHVVEYFARHGIREFDFILNHLPEQIEAYFGDGARWGCRFRHHLAPGYRGSWKLLRTICTGFDDRVVLAGAERFPAVSWQPEDETPTALFREALREAGGGPRWTGWASFPSNLVAACFPTDDRDEIERQLLSGHGALAARTIADWISVDSPADILASQRLLLDERASAMQLTGTQGEKGAWIGRNASIHPTARLTPPFYVGPNSRISAGTRIGPYAIVGERCIIDEHSSVDDAMVAPGTYIGEGLEVSHAIIDRNLLVNARLDAAYLISEAFVAGGLESGGGLPVGRAVLNRIAALILLVILSPLLIGVLLAAVLFPGLRLRREAFVATPAAEDARTWRVVYRLVVRLGDTAGRPHGLWSHFFREFLPGLISVVGGSVTICGVPPRPAAALRALPADWRSLCLRCPSGLITEDLTVCGPDASEEELYSAESFYFAVKSFTYDVKLLLRYAGRLLTGGGPVGAIGAPAGAALSGEDE